MNGRFQHQPLGVPNETNGNTPEVLVISPIDSSTLKTTFFGHKLKFVQFLVETHLSTLSTVLNPQNMAGSAGLPRTDFQAVWKQLSSDPLSGSFAGKASLKNWDGLRIEDNEAEICLLAEIVISYDIMIYHISTLI